MIDNKQYLDEFIKRSISSSIESFVNEEIERQAEDIKQKFIEKAKALAVLSAIDISREFDIQRSDIGVRFIISIKEDYLK